MILGIGIDSTDLRRIDKALQRFGDRFVQRIFTEEEQLKSEGRGERLAKKRVASYARRFAAKEACAKALGTGMSQGVNWREIQMSNDDHGQPVINLAGQAKARLAQLAPAGYGGRVHVSVTDEPPYAKAIVIIEAVQSSAS